MVIELFYRYYATIKGSLRILLEIMVLIKFIWLCAAYYWIWEYDDTEKWRQVWEVLYDIDYFAFSGELIFIYNITRMRVIAHYADF